MSVDSIIARARRRMVDVMDTTVTVKRGTSTGAYNAATKTYTPTGGAVVYDGQAIVHVGTQAGGPRSGEEGAVVQVPFLVKFPALTDIQRGDSVTVTASVHDTGLTGLSFWVLDTDIDEWSICRTAYCTDQVAEVNP